MCLIEERKNAKVAHKLQLFLRDASHWETRVTIPARSLPSWYLPTNPPVRPQPIISYGRNTFDSTSTHPTLFRKHLRSPRSRERFLSFLSAPALLNR